MALGVATVVVSVGGWMEATAAASGVAEVGLVVAEAVD